MYLYIASDLLGRNLVVVGPHVDLLVGVHTREDEEHPRAPGPAHQQPAQSEDDGPLILLRQTNTNSKDTSFMRNQNFQT